MLKYLLLLTACILLLGSCIGPKQYSRYVTERYDKAPKYQLTPPSGISVDASAITRFNSVASVAKRNAYFIPALFYWGWDTELFCSLDGLIPVNQFIGTINRYADSIHLSQKIRNRQLELSVVSVPREYTYLDRGDLIFILLAYVEIDKQAAYPENKDLIVNFKLRNGDIVEKQGQIVVPDANMAYSKSRHRGTRKFVNKYHDIYDRNIDRMTRQFLLLLNDKLEQ